MRQTNCVRPFVSIALVALLALVLAACGGSSSATPMPTLAPTLAPTAAPAPTTTPTSVPTSVPTTVPSATPTRLPTQAATLAPSPTAGARGQINIAFTTDPAQPVVGQPATITIRVFAVGGPLTIALVGSFSISAVSSASGTVLSAAATALPNGPGGSYSASMTFPSAGVWHLATDNFKSAPGNDFDVTVVGAPSSDVPACRAADLSADAQWQGAAGSRIGTITVTNNGASACLLAAYPAVRIENTQGRIAPTDNASFTDASDVGGDIVLQPGQQGVADVRWSNRCPQAAANDTFLLRVTLPNGNGSFTVPTSVPPCLGDTQSSHLSQQPFTLRGDAAQVVRDYYMAINRHDYRAAYALFSAGMRQNQSYEDFAAGFAMTQEDDLHIRAIAQNGSQSVITIALSTRARTGDTRRYTGTYTVGSENGARRIVAANIALA